MLDSSSEIHRNTQASSPMERTHTDRQTDTHTHTHTHRAILFCYLASKIPTTIPVSSPYQALISFSKNFHANFVPLTMVGRSACCCCCCVVDSFHGFCVLVVSFECQAVLIVWQSLVYTTSLHCLELCCYILSCYILTYCPVTSLHTVLLHPYILPCYNLTYCPVTSLHTLLYILDANDKGGLRRNLSSFLQVGNTLGELEGCGKCCSGNQAHKDVWLDLWAIRSFNSNNRTWNTWIWGKWSFSIQTDSRR